MNRLIQNKKIDFNTAFTNAQQNIPKDGNGNLEQFGGTYTHIYKEMDIPTILLNIGIKYVKNNTYNGGKVDLPRIPTGRPTINYVQNTQNMYVRGEFERSTRKLKITNISFTNDTDSEVIKQNGKVSADPNEWNDVVDFLNQTVPTDTSKSKNKLFIEFREKVGTNNYYYSQHHKLNDKYRFSQNPINGLPLDNNSPNPNNVFIDNKPRTTLPAANGSGPKFQTLDFISVDFNETKVYNGTSEEDINTTNMSEEVLNLIVHQLVQYKMADTVFSYFKDANKISKFSVKEGTSLISYNTHHKGIQIMSDENLNVFSQCILKNNGLIFAAAKIKLSDSTIKISACNNKSFLAMANLTKATAISKPDRKISNDDSILYFVLKNTTPSNQYFYTYCMSNSDMRDDDLDKKNIFNYKPQTGDCEKKSDDPIGVFIVDNNKKIYLVCENYPTNIAKMVLHHKTGGNRYVRFDSIQAYKTQEAVDFESNSNGIYKITVNNNKVYDENGSKELNDIVPYVCTYNFNPYELDIDLINKIFEK
jgi:hypothetical protein